MSKLFARALFCFGLLVGGWGCGSQDSIPGLESSYITPEQPSSEQDAGCEGARCEVEASPEDSAAKDSAPSQEGSAAHACAPGEQRECRITAQYNGVTSCIIGVESCEDGAWGGCIPLPE